MFVNDRATSILYFRNNNSGNIHPLAHAPAGSPISGAVTSARANFVAFMSTAAFVGDTAGLPAVSLQAPDPWAARP